MNSDPSSLRLSARRAAPQALAWIRNTRQARFLHISKSTCNLINPQGAVVALTGPEVGAGPFAIVLSGERVNFLEHINENDPIRVGPERIRLGDLVVDVRAARRWSPCPDWARFQRQIPQVRAAASSLADWLVQNAPSGSLAALLPHLAAEGTMPGRPTDETPDRFAQAALAPAQRLCSGIAAADPDVCQSAARDLAGLGSGLTPAGDDFLLGAAYAAWTFLPTDAAGALTRAMAEAALPRTTPLSAAFLQAAARGEASAAWHTFLRRLSCSDMARLQAASDRILKSGHTSGADALSGFIGVSLRFNFAHVRA